MATMSPQEIAAANQRHAAKMGHRADNPDKVQRYPANRSRDGMVAHIYDRHQAKLEARVAAFNAGRRPDENGHLDVDLTPKADAAKVEEAKASDPKPAKPGKG